MALGIIAEALLRIEHKVDALIKAFDIKTTPLHFIGQACPVCQQFVDFTVDVQKGVAVRRCGCKTGKVPSMIPLTPVTEAPRNVTPLPADSTEWTTATERPSDGTGRKGR